VFPGAPDPPGDGPLPDRDRVESRAGRPLRDRRHPPDPRYGGPDRHRKRLFRPRRPEDRHRRDLSGGRGGGGRPAPGRARCPIRLGPMARRPTMSTRRRCSGGSTTRSSASSPPLVSYPPWWRAVTAREPLSLPAGAASGPVARAPTGCRSRPDEDPDWQLAAGRLRRDDDRPPGGGRAEGDGSEPRRPRGDRPEDRAAPRRGAR